MKKWESISAIFTIWIMNEPLTFLPSMLRSCWSLTISECFHARVVERAIVLQKNSVLLPTSQRSWIQHVTVIKANNTVLFSIMCCTSGTWMIREDPRKQLKFPKIYCLVQHCWWEEYFRKFCETKKFPGFLPHEFIIITVNWTFCRLHSVCVVRKRKWKQKSFQHKDQHEIPCFLFGRRQQRFRWCSVDFSRAC